MDPIAQREPSLSHSIAAGRPWATIRSSTTES